MTVQETLTILHDKIKSFEFIEKDSDNGMLAFLQKDIMKLRCLIANAVACDTKLSSDDNEVYLDKFDAPLALLHKFSKQSTPEIRLSKLPLIKLSVDTGINLFLTACENANSGILLKEENEIPDVRYPYAIKEGLTSIFGV